MSRTEGRLRRTEGRLRRTEGRLRCTEGRLRRTEGRSSETEGARRLSFDGVALFLQDCTNPIAQIALKFDAAVQNRASRAARALQFL